jgi:hypothetical protein
VPPGLRRMVLSAEKRKALATKLNGMIKLPLLNEAQEQKIAESVINAVIAPLESAMPTDSEMMSMARSSGEETMQKSVKQQVVEKINKKIDIPGLSEAHEAVLFGMVVDFVLKDKFAEIHRSLTAAPAPAPVTADATVPAAADNRAIPSSTATNHDGCFAECSLQ